MSFTQLRSLVSTLCRIPRLNTQSYRSTRYLSVSARRLQEDGGEEVEATVSNRTQKRLQIDPDTSIRYLDSNAYNECYEDDPVWTHYRRNFKGQIPPQTRTTCVRGGVMSTGNPCPICRDEYLVFDYKNVKLLNQFISPYTGEIYDSMKTGICQKQQKKLQLEIFKAREYGYLEAAVPYRVYNYDEYVNDIESSEQVDQSVEST